MGALGDGGTSGRSLGFFSHTHRHTQAFVSFVTIAGDVCRCLAALALAGGGDDSRLGRDPRGKGKARLASYLCTPRIALRVSQTQGPMHTGHLPQGDTVRHTGSQ